jgi:hypothetical protein
MFVLELDLFKFIIWISYLGCVEIIILLSELTFKP